MPFELYKKMIGAYKNNDDHNFEATARNWIESSEKNPFEIKEARELFFNAKKYCKHWRAGGIDSRSSKRNMIECCRKIAAMGIGYPADLAEEELQKEKDRQYKEELAKEVVQEQTEENISEELKSEDSIYVLFATVKAYNAKDETNFKQFTIHFMDITEENPFSTESDEYKKFEEMKQAYARHNMRRLFVVTEQLCEIINNTEVKEEPKKIILEEPKVVLGVPDESKEEEKRSWLSFLNPWRKEGETK